MESLHFIYCDNTWTCIGQKKQKIDKINKISVTFPFFSKIGEKCEKIQKSVKKSHKLNIALCDLKLNQNGPSIWGLV